MPSTLQFNSIDELLPHEPPMMLLSRLEQWDEKSVEVSISLDGSNLFSNEQGDVPSWVGIEYMAQSISVFSGIRNRLKGKPVQIGFLLGTRKYTSQVSHFKKGSILFVRADMDFLDEDGLGLFHCVIKESHSEGKEFARAQVKVIQPEDVDKIITGENIL